MIEIVNIVLVVFSILIILGICFSFVWHLGFVAGLKSQSKQKASESFQQP